MTPSDNFSRRLPFGQSSTLDWPAIFAPLAQYTSYEARLDALLEVLGRATGLAVIALYLADSPEGRFHLVRLHRPTPERKAPEATQPGPRAGFLGGALGGRGQEAVDARAVELVELDEALFSDSVISVTAGLSLDLPRRDKYGTLSVISSPLGSLYSVPLIREGLSPVQIGMVQVGPIPDKPGRGLRKVMASAAAPLTHAIALAREQALLKEQLTAYETRADVSRQMLRSAFELSEFLNLLLDLAVKASGTQAGFIALADESGAIRLHTDSNLPDGLLDGLDLTPGTGFLEWLDEADGSLYVSDFLKAAELGIQVILAVPLMDEERLLGVLGLMNLEGGRTPAEHSLTLLGIFAEQIQLVLGNVLLFEAFNQRFADTLHALSLALDARYAYSAGHHRRVTDWTLAIGRELGLTESQLEDLRVAGLGHDVGMCGIVEAEHGFQADFYHPSIGGSMFDLLPNSQAISEVIATHHEWYDGWGFPAGLKGDEIPIGGRILALAEFITESTTADPIQAAFPPSKLIAEIETRRGRQFDPAVVDAWRDVFDRQRGQAAIGTPFRPCYQFKGEPEAACATCPARPAHDEAAIPCWTIPDVRCTNHGDPDCTNCFVYLEAQDRAEAAGEELPAPLPHSVR